MALQIILSADVEPMFHGVPSLPAVPPAPPLPANLRFRPPHSQMRKAELNYDSDNDSGRGGSMLFMIEQLPGLNLSDDEFSEEFSCAGSEASSRRGSSSIAGNIPVPPPPPPLPQDRSQRVRLDLLLPHRIPQRNRDSLTLPLPRIPQRNRSSLTLPRGLRPAHSDDSLDSLSMSWDDPIEPIQDITHIDFDHEDTCIVCYNTVYGTSEQRPCCKKAVCCSCISAIIHTNIEEGLVFIACPNPECKNGVIRREEVLQYTTGRTRDLYEKMRLEAENDETKKACPNCCHITEHKLPSRTRRFREEDVKITCEKCTREWCFRCHAPWHTNMSCRQFKKGDKQFFKWTKGRSNNGIANCQKCPLCQVYIQRSTGCDHMTCNRCDTGFCYKCGERFIEFPGLGDHYTRTSVLGCKYNYNADKPTKRMAVRGGYFGAKLAMLTGYPVLFVAGAAVVLVVGAVALPIYGGYKYYKYRKNTRRHRARRRR